MDDYQLISKTVEYGAWRGIIQRCLNPNCPNYKYYGGRGITVCDRWRHSFKNFFDDMGKRPVGLTIDRVNNNKGYFPRNCRWATSTVQIRNRGLQKRNISGTIGVTWCKPLKKWVAVITVKRKKYHLGYFVKLADAVEARKNGEDKYW